VYSTEVDDAFSATLRVLQERCKATKDTLLLVNPDDPTSNALLCLAHRELDHVLTCFRRVLRQFAQVRATAVGGIAATRLRSGADRCLAFFFTLSITWKKHIR